MIKSKRTFFLWALLLVVIFGVVVYMKLDVVSRFLWSHSITPPIAMVNDAVLAHSIGEHFYSSDEDYGEYDVEKATQYFKKATVLDPNLPGAHFQLGKVYFVAGDMKEALVEFETELALSKQNENTSTYYYPSLYMKALTHGFMKELNQSALFFEQLLNENADDSRSWAYYTDLAWVYFQQGKFEKIKEIMEGEENEQGKVIGGMERYPNNPWVLNMYALALHNLGESDRAHELLIKARGEAVMLTEADWVRAYPGNDPDNAQRGLDDFKEVIALNIELTEKKVEENETTE